MTRVLIVGAGIVGAAVARELAVAGFEVVVLDRGAAAGGTSGSGEGNLLVSDKGPGPELQLAQHATRVWPAITAALRHELGERFPSIEFEPKGGVVVALSDAGAAALTAFAATQRAAGVVANEVDRAQALDLEPHLSPGITAAVHYPDDAQVQPVIAAEALLASARLHGAVVLPGHDVIAARRDARGRVTGVRTERAEFEADQVIVAAGPWSGEVAARLGAALDIRPRRGMVLVTTRMPHRVFHKVYDADYVGAVGSGSAALQFSSVVESTAAGTVLIGSSRQQIGFDDRMRVAVLEGLAARAIALFPFLADAAVMRTYGGFRPYTPDHLPVIGADPRHPGLWYATGHEGAGIGLSVSTAHLVRDLMTGRPPDIDPRPFDPGRECLTPKEGNG